MSHCNPFQIFAQVCRFVYKIRRKTGNHRVYFTGVAWRYIKSPIDGGRWPSKSSTVCATNNHTNNFCVMSWIFFFLTVTHVSFYFSRSRKKNFFSVLSFVTHSYGSNSQGHWWIGYSLNEVRNIKYVRSVATGRNWFKSYLRVITMLAKHPKVFK